MVASIVVKMVTDRLNVPNRKNSAAVVVVVVVAVAVAVVVAVADQVSYSSIEYKHFHKILFSDACFNCGQEGHRSYECTEPKKAGGGGGGGSGKFLLNEK
jgi:hypothetical protein